MAERAPLQQVARRLVEMRQQGRPIAEAAAEVQAMGWQPADVKSEMAKAPPGWLGSVVQGITFGLGDEMRAGVRGGARALMGEKFGPAYDQELERARAGQARFSAEHPYVDAGLQVAGGMALPVGGAVKGAATLGHAAMRGALTGGATGAAYGFGTGEGVGNRTARALAGGVTGAAVGGAVAPAAEAIGRGLSMQTAPGARGVARGTLAEAVGDEGMTLAAAADEIAAANAAGKTGVTPADVMQGGRVTGLMRDVAQSPNPAQAALRQQFETRQRGQFERVVADLGQATGVGAKRSVAETKRLFEGRQKAAAPDFAKAWQFDTAGNPTVRDAFAELMQTAAGPRAYQRAVEIAKNEAPGFKPPALNELVDENGALRAVPNMHFMHFMKMGLDSLYNSAARGQEGMDQTIARSIKGVRNRFRDTLKGENKPYQTALDRFSGSIALEDAIALGRDMFARPPDEFAAALTDLSSKGEKEAFRIGALSKLTELVGEGRRGPSADFTMKLRSVNMEQKLPVLIGDPKRSADFMKSLGIEEAFSRTASRAVGNSVTSEGRELAEQAGGDIAAGQVMAEAYKAGTPSGFLMTLFNATLGKVQKDLSAAFKKRFRGEMGQMLTRTDADAEALLRSLGQRPPSPSYRTPQAAIPLAMGANRAVLPPPNPGLDLLGRPPDLGPYPELNGGNGAALRIR